jgi:hypothetical protein
VGLCILTLPNGGSAGSSIHLDFSVHCVNYAGGCA